MMAATDGSNAHRGAIWTLGLLVAATAQLSDQNAASIGAAAATLARLPDRFAPRPLSHGERARLRYGAAGARGEAQATFPHAIRVGLPALRAARDRGVPENWARLDALMAIMASLDDAYSIGVVLPRLKPRRRGPEPYSLRGGRQLRPDTSACIGCMPNSWHDGPRRAGAVICWPSPCFLIEWRADRPPPEEESAHGNIELRV